MPLEQEELQHLYPSLSENNCTRLLSLLDEIECPPDCRGLQLVLDFLCRLYKGYQTYFKLTFRFSFDDDILSETANIHKDRLSSYSNRTIGEGWKSERPFYALLFEFASKNTAHSYEGLLFFIQFYFQHEKRVVHEGREEQIMRAFRMVFFNVLFDHRCLKSTHPKEIASRCYHHGQFLVKQKNDMLDVPSNKHANLKTYLYELMHFYRLDWKKRERKECTKIHHFHDRYSGKKLHKLIGTDRLYAFSLSRRKSEEDLNEGLCLDEDYPIISIIAENPSKEEKRPRYQRPSTKLINDPKKQKKQAKRIRAQVRRGHNLTLLSRTLLQTHELFYLCQALFTPNKGGLTLGIAESEIQKLIFLMLFLGREAEKVIDLTYITDIEGDMGFLLQDKTWYLKMPVIATSLQGKYTHSCSTLNTQSYCLLTLPTFVIEKLQLNPKAKAGEVLINTGSLKTLQKSAEQFIKKINKKYRQQMSLSRITCFLQNHTQATEQIDPVFIEILKGEINYITRAARHYAWYSSHEISLATQALWRRVFQSIKQAFPAFSLPNTVFKNDINHKGQMRFDFSHDASETVGVGSPFTPKLAVLQEKTAALFQQLSHFSAPHYHSLEAMLNYHNQYTLYTAFMLLASTGYRAVHSPLPSFNLCLLRYGLLCISDKDEALDHAHMRLVPIPSVLATQLTDYLAHLNVLASALSFVFPYQAAHFHRHMGINAYLSLSGRLAKDQVFEEIKNNRNQSAMLLFCDLNSTEKKTKLNVQAISPASLKARDPTGIDLPINAGRHYLRRYLTQQDLHQELIKFQLGHWVAGEIPLSDFSSLNHMDAAKILIPHLETMMMEIGWQAKSSILTRKRLDK